MAQRKTSRRAKLVGAAEVRRLALALPGASEAPSYGTPGFRVRGKLFARLHQDGESLVVKIDRDERELRVQADPAVYFVTDHYVGYDMMLVRLVAVHRDDLADLLEQSWRRCASKRQISDFEGP